MTRHPPTEGNDLKPKRVDAENDVTVPDGEGGRFSIKNVQAKVKETAVQYSDQVFPGLYG